MYLILSCELPEEIIKEINPTYVDFSVSINEKKIDKNISNEELIKLLSESENPPTTAAPSPGDFLNGIKKKGRHFV